MGSLIGAAVYLTRLYLPNIWKNKEMGPIYSFLFLGFVAGCVLSYIWLNDREDEK